MGTTVRLGEDALCASVDRIPGRPTRSALLDRLDERARSPSNPRANLLVVHDSVVSDERAGYGNVGAGLFDDVRVGVVQHDPQGGVGARGTVGHRRWVDPAGGFSGRFGS